MPKWDDFKNKGEDAAGEYQQAVVKYQEASSLYTFAIQAEQNRITEESGVRSAMAKSAHDAMEAIIRNMA
jgi:hypothetical protein